MVKNSKVIPHETNEIHIQDFVNTYVVNLIVYILRFDGKTTVFFMMEMVAELFFNFFEVLVDIIVKFEVFPQCLESVNYVFRVYIAIIGRTPAKLIPEALF